MNLRIQKIFFTKTSTLAKVCDRAKRASRRGSGISSVVNKKFGHSVVTYFPV